MERDKAPDVRGTVRDWPAWIVFVGVVLWVGIAASGRQPTLLLFLLIAFGAVTWMIRRGVFSPRR